LQHSRGCLNHNALLGVGSDYPASIVFVTEEVAATVDPCDPDENRLPHQVRDRRIIEQRLTGKTNPVHKDADAMSHSPPVHFIELY